MKCPKCQNTMKATHTYGVPNGKTQRMVCEECGTYVTAQTVIVAVNPKYGEGAASLARRLARKKQPLTHEQ